MTLALQGDAEAHGAVVSLRTPVHAAEVVALVDARFPIHTLTVVAVFVVVVVSVLVIAVRFLSIFS